ncbi:glycoside hydrolase family 31 protein [Levilactobacillus wangkuiensis]|uniref:glycoside hydrolase family 31 protein n=2 Tax=Levilactobacillus wangkuiensis TaxID=2799566 RepID=UPI001942DBB6|nr:glycoside hydrolase family 31 protein [Levilactobacillus wangkuiensis]
MITVNELTTNLKQPLQIEILTGEEWYGGDIFAGSQYPLTKGSSYKLDLFHLETYNQVAPAFVSSKGRVLTSQTPFSLTVSGDRLSVVTQDHVKLVAGNDGLKGSQQWLAQHTFELGSLPPQEFFELPQWNTWMELLYQQNQTDILAYAHSIVANGFPAGIIMIDDLWADYYGRWEFSARKFPDAPAMIQELHTLGFKVMVWACPFVSPDSPEFRDLRDRDMLLKRPDGKPVVREWWNGYSAILDLSNPATYQWFKETLQNLQETTGVDGFKLDAGDSYFYRDDDVSHMNLSPVQQTELWGKFGKEFPYNEFRALYKNQGAPLVNRLQDKQFAWGEQGLSELIPDTIAQGLMGYYFSCPDMIGGGEIGSLKSLETFDQELIVRSAQCSALMPMMQFSLAPWRVLDQEHLDICRQTADLHQQFAPTIIKLAEHAAKTGEPIVQTMAYDHPETPQAYLKTQFKLGPALLVAPVLEAHATTKSVYFPAGQWQSVTDETAATITGPAEVDLPVTLRSLPAYRRL